MIWSSRTNNVKAHQCIAPTGHGGTARFEDVVYKRPLHHQGNLRPIRVLALFQMICGCGCVLQYTYNRTMYNFVCILQYSKPLKVGTQICVVSKCKSSTCIYDTWSLCVCARARTCALVCVLGVDFSRFEIYYTHLHTSAAPGRAHAQLEVLLTTNASVCLRTWEEGSPRQRACQRENALFCLLHTRTSLDIPIRLVKHA
jgi:hypothetical protein